MKSFYHEEIRFFPPPDPSVSNRSLGKSPRQSARNQEVTKRVLLPLVRGAKAVS